MLHALCKKNILKSGFLNDFTDIHSHILFGVDDGAPHIENSIEILSYFENLGVSNIWLTPHIMEDIPNTTDKLQKQFFCLKQAYQGKINLYLAAEYMLDTLFDKRLQQNDLLCLNNQYLLTETSYLSPPYGLDQKLYEIALKGYNPILAHPERYNYMQMDEYKSLKNKGVFFQLNLLSLFGMYGKSAFIKSRMLLRLGFYDFVGTDIHDLSFHKNVFLTKKIESSCLKSLMTLKANNSIVFYMT